MNIANKARENTAIEMTLVYSNSIIGKHSTFKAGCIELRFAL
jgi:hypothetical protein